MNHKELYTERIEIRVSKEQRKIIQELAKKYHLTMNEAIRQSIMDAWENV